MDVNMSILYGRYVWEEVEVGQNDSHPCVYGSLNGMGVASRVCRAPLIWDDPVYVPVDEPGCFTRNTKRFQELLNSNVS